jgi:quinol-cytochrome oxidoreductase complex cytochrome b subunit
LDWLVLGFVLGAFLGMAVIAFATHGTATVSGTERHAEHSLFWIQLYDEHGSSEAVKAVEGWWLPRLFAGGAVVGSLMGLAIAFWRQRRISSKLLRA